MLIRTNVENIGDPFIVCADNSYYMYATSFDCCGFRVRRSKDLKNWVALGVCLDMSNGWAERDFWAPEVIFHNGKYVMHYTARRKSDKSLRIGVAIADVPQGPFVDQGVMFDFGYAAIDGHVFLDDDGERYLYYSKDCSENIIDGISTSQIYMVKLNEDLTKAITDPMLIFGPTEDFECLRYHSLTRWNEGPFMLKSNGKYYLTYSANCYGTKEYCICLAISNRPDGGFKKDGKNPILSYKDVAEDFSGPGHNAFFIDLDGKLKMTFHIHTYADQPSGNRKAVICDAEIEAETITFDLDD
jgi:beta-xylosidase